MCYILIFINTKIFSLSLFGVNCVGKNDKGQAPPGPTWPENNNTKFIQVSVSVSFTCAVTNKGAYECVGGWGKGSTKPKNIDAKFIQVSAGIGLFLKRYQNIQKVKHKIHHRIQQKKYFHHGCGEINA